MTSLCSSRRQKRLTLSLLLVISAWSVALAEDTVAVMPLREGPDAGLTDRELIYEYVLSSLVRTRRYEVIDYRQRESLLEEIRFSLAAVSEMDDEIRAGRLLAARYVLIPFVSRLSGEYHVMLKIVETETGRVVHTEMGVAPTESALPTTVERTVTSLVSAVRSDGTIAAHDGGAPSAQASGPSPARENPPPSGVMTVGLDAQDGETVVYSGEGLAGRLLMVRDNSIVETYRLSLISSTGTGSGRMRHYGLSSGEGGKASTITGSPGQTINLRFYVYKGLWSGSQQREVERAIRAAGGSVRSVRAGNSEVRLIHEARVEMIPGRVVRITLPTR